MLPGVYEFSWSPGHVIFVTFFMAAIAAVAIYAVSAVVRAGRDGRRGRAGALRWHETFEALPPERRVCRHELSTSAEPRLCTNGFDCAHCKYHAALAHDEPGTDDVLTIHGLPIRPGEYYGRGHATVRPVDNDTVDIFPDALAQILLRACRIQPRAGDGDHLHLGDTAFRIACPRGPLRIMTPVAGEVIAHDEAGDVPTLRVRLDQPLAEQKQLLEGIEAARWLEDELHAVERAVAPGTASPTLADGGEIRSDLVESSPEVDWDQVYEDIFLNG